ncbi:MAG: NAD(P)/FAD-dependent oxidoreductase [Mediterranea sp.]|jgi:protoporphyrinogen oxidase|nr:NAD(P)/FAD-dependent oxidoreductase [Mediterranea sp.]
MKEKEAEEKNEKKAIIIGAGPAGLTAAHELLNTAIRPVVLEESGEFGGISKTVNYKGNRIDIGGHRFFSKNNEVMKWWDDVMPLQGKPSKDQILLHTEKEVPLPGKADPERTDRVMLLRHRVSRIFYLRSFFDYPISLKLRTFTNMGLARTVKAGFGYLRSMLFKRTEKSLEDFYVNRFGRPLYRMFFEDYTEKVWGVHPSKLGADWGSQRVKGLSITAVLKNMLLPRKGKSDDISQKDVETSLIERFIYPKLGPGQLWETVARDIQPRAEVVTRSKVTRIHVEAGRVVAVDAEENGQTITRPCDYLLSSMPIKDLVAAISGIEVPADVRRVAAGLPYRDFITVGLLVKKLKIENRTKIKTWERRVPDTWIYIQERDVKIGRLQVFNNWSPYMVKDYENTMWIGLEYFCTEGDEMWRMEDRAFIDMAIGELARIDILDPADVLDSTRIKIRKAYPSYFGTYNELDKVKAFLDQIENLYCIGRNGQHRYNNMDHSMLTAMEAVKNIRTNKTSKENVWAVNTEEKYHESKN